jgi:ribonuclease P protein component
MASAPAVTSRDMPRIVRSSDIKRVLSQGRRYPAERVAASVLEADGDAAVALVSSRAVGGAVQRNRARRLMREAWRQLQTRVVGGHRVVLVARPGIVGAGLGEVAADVERVLLQAGVIA